MIYKGYAKGITDRIKEQDALNYLLGKYIAFSVNAPQKYPRKPFLDSYGSHDDVRSHIMTSKQMEDTLKGIATKFNKKKDGNRN